jgi:hypothetical protein
MYTIILLSILTIVGFVGGWLIDKYTYADGWVCAFVATGVISVSGLIAALCLLINIDKRFDATIYTYETTVQMIDSYAGQDYGNMGSLVEQVVKINNTIASHKAHYTSNWVGLWYSEEIGNLEPITFGKKVQDVPALE